MTTFYAAVLVTSRPESLDACIRGLVGLEGVAIHALDRETGRILVVDSTETAADYEERLRRIRRAPDVIDARLVLHHVDAGPSPKAPGGSS